MSVTSKSDIYSISLNSLLLGSYPKNTIRIQELLDDSGYYGRSKIIRAPSVNKDILINIEVYLPDSVYSYVWPYKTTYNVTSNSFGKRRTPSVIKNSFRFNKIMMFLSLCGVGMSTGVDDLALLGSKFMGWATKDDYAKTILFFVKCNMFRDRMFCLKTKEDVTEVQNNLFDANYFNIDF
jgi:hypothetical protein